MPGTTYLPAEGRQGDAPEWPLASMTSAEEVAWRDLWATPQAEAWAQLGIGAVRVVARYCRLVCTAEASMAGKPTVAGVQAIGEARQLEDRLGLTPMAMLRLRWEVVADELAAARSDAPQPVTQRRIRAVE
ncbi:hypothetical protein BBK14_01850 [Parafrankia soli]|uniref:Uncharacterized protein n=1 Tax=Parafrankia soli TaxID=2599596 RepID=A0A1S1RKK4_9ACTN|nr:hypothetical protein [Parafrankia soli]OHV46616.1 hypothetical protein BBK14_01850 [Parafrankia soli]